MRINSKLWIAEFVPLFVALVVGAALIFSYRVSETAQENGDKVRLIRNSINEMNQLVFSYVTYRGERPKLQFLAEHDKLTTLMSGLHLRDLEQQQLLNEILLNSQFMKEAFLSLVSNTEQLSQVKTDPFLQYAAGRLAGQLLIKSRSTDSIASRLLNLVYADIRKIQTKTIPFIFLIMVVAALPFTFLLAHIRKRITSDLATLRYGTVVISSGNLDEVIPIKGPDEIGELTQAFNRMTANLKEVTASRTDLEKEMAEREKAEKELRASRKFLEIANRHVGLDSLLQDYVGEIKEFTGCEAVGIRLREENGNIPYMAYLGFSQKFYETESPLSLKTDRCMCINVIKGATDPGMSFYTEGGSFYMNGTTRFLATVPEEDKGQTRNACNQTGYESVALIPIRLGTNILGLIHLADRRENRVPLNIVKILEQVASALGIGIQRTLAEEALRESETRFRSYFELGLIGMAITSPHKGLVEVNDELCEILGYERGELFKLKWAELSHADDLPADRDQFNRILAGEIDSYSMDKRFIHKTGQIVNTTLSVRCVRNTVGSVKFFVALVQDTTERKKAEEERERLLQTVQSEKERLLALINSIQDEVWFADSDNNISLVNPAVLKEFGLTDLKGEKTEKIAESLKVFLPNGAPRPVDEAPLRRALRGEVVSGQEEIMLIPTRGELRHRQVNAAPVKDSSGRIVGSVSVIRDITKRKQMEEDLRRSHDELEVRVQKRTAELTATVARLEQLNRELEEFAFIASHDLQEPLRKIEIFSDLAQKRYAPVVDQTGQDYLDRVHKSAARMRLLLHDLLKLSRVTTKLKPFQEIDLSNIVKEVVEVFEPAINETDGRIEIEPMPVIEADESQMLQLFQNLIGNALKFRDNKKPLIRVYGRATDLGFCEIMVKDNGIGFDPKFAEQIFKPFERLHSRSEYEGTGMGLAICRKIVERHGGVIRGESEPGKGTTFIVRMPIKQARPDGYVDSKHRLGSR
jgi:PAS domain S-box-containing protein